jgi:hypothetical protein
VEGSFTTGALSPGEVIGLFNFQSAVVSTPVEYVGVGPYAVREEGAAKTYYGCQRVFEPYWHRIVTAGLDAERVTSTTPDSIPSTRELISTTFISFRGREGGPRPSFEVLLPAGKYRVMIGMGGYWYSSGHRFSIEDVVVESEGNTLVEREAVVNVVDGKMEIVAEKPSCLNYLKIYVQQILALERHEEKDCFFRRVYPNPVNPECYIPVNVKGKMQNVKLKIYNILGQLVREIECSGINVQDSRVYWDGKDSRGLEVPSGVYFYEIGGGKVRRMVVLR